MTVKPTYEELEKRVHELEKIESELEDSKEMLRVYEKASLGYQSLDENGHYITVNQTWLDTLGYTREEVIGKSFADFIHPDWRDHFKENFPGFKSIGEVLGVEFQMVKKNGDFILVSLTGKIGRNKKGDFQRTHCIFHDITDRKRVEEDLQKEKDVLKAVVDSIPVMITRYDPYANVLYLNKEFERKIGWKTEELRNINMMEEVYPDPAYRKIAQEYMEKAVIEWQEFSVRAKSGKSVISEWSNICLDDGTRIGIGIDVTGRKQAEEELQISEKRVRAKLNAVLHPEGDMGRLSLVDIIDTAKIQRLMDGLYELTNIGGAIVDLDGNVVVATELREICARFHRMHPDALENCIESDTELTDGIEPGQFREYRCKNNMWDMATPIVIGDKLFGNIFIGQFFYDDEDIDYGAFRVQARKFGFDEQTYMDALDCVPRLSRNVVEMAMSYYSRFAEMISTLSYSNLKLARTIEEHKRNERERDKLQAQLTQAQKMESVGRLAGGVAHDFNNMLGIILGHADMILDEMDPDQPFYADLTAIRKAGERSADLTRQLLAFARKQTIAPKVIDLNETIESMLKMLRRLIGEDIDLAWRPGKKVWPVNMDPAQIDQILANLCVNARDAIAGVGKMTIETDNIVFDGPYCKDHAGFVPGAYVMIALSDNGCGMDSETMSHLYEPFFTTKALGKGTGLGLATVYGVVKQNNGFINAYSEPGQGTTFKVYLPRHLAKAGFETKESRPLAAARGNETVLLVEDEPAILKMTTMMLDREGYTVLAAGTPGEAIRLANEHAGDIHILMSDVVMPEMNGRDLAKTILSLYPHMKCLFMSGYTANVIARHGVLDEGVNFIQKPFSKRDLTVKVREVLEG